MLNSSLFGNYVIHRAVESVFDESSRLNSSRVFKCRVQWICQFGCRFKTLSRRSEFAAKGLAGIHTRVATHACTQAQREFKIRVLYTRLPTRAYHASSGQGLRELALIFYFIDIGRKTKKKCQL